MFYVTISYHARFCLQTLYPEILFTMLKGFWNCGSFIGHSLLLRTSKAFTLSVFLPGTHVLPGTRRCNLVLLVAIFIIRFDNIGPAEEKVCFTLHPILLKKKWTMTVLPFTMQKNLEFIQNFISLNVFDFMSSHCHIHKFYPKGAVKVVN